MAVNITWDFVLVWLLFAIAVVFLVKPMLPLFRKKKTAPDSPSDCTKCHP